MGGEIRGVGFSPDGRFAITYGDAVRVLIWDIVAGSFRFLATDAAIKHACFTSEGTRLLTISAAGTAQAWRLLDDAAIHRAVVGQPPLSLAAFNGDNHLMVLVCEDSTARVWQVNDAAPLSLKLHHDAPIVHAQFVDARG